jgi:hypothetical protein
MPKRRSRKRSPRRKFDLSPRFQLFIFVAMISIILFEPEVQPQSQPQLSSQVQQISSQVQQIGSTIFSGSSSTTTVINSPPSSTAQQTSCAFTFVYDNSNALDIFSTTNQKLSAINYVVSITPSWNGPKQSHLISGALTLSVDGTQKESYPLLNPATLASGSPATIYSGSISSATLYSYSAIGTHTLTISINGVTSITFTDGTTDTKPMATSASVQYQAVAPNTATYKIAIEGSTYAARNTANNIVTTSSDLGAVLNTLNSQLVSGDSISISSGTYNVNTMPTISANYITIYGIGNPTLRLSTSLTKYGFTLSGSHNTVKNITVDSNNNIVISPTFMVNGPYNTVEYCTFKNAVQYCLLAFATDHFTFTHNTFNRAQYGIATGGGNGYALATYGTITYNNFVDCRDCGIKLRWCENTLVKYNTVDIKWISWMSQTIQSDQQPAGIRFYQADGPTHSVTVSSNTITNSGSSSWTVAGKTYFSVGVLIDADAMSNWGTYNTPSAGQVISDNTISNVYRGIRNSFSPSTIPSISNNVFSNCGVNIFTG